MKPPVTGILDNISFSNHSSFRFINSLNNRFSASCRSVCSYAQGYFRDILNHDYPSVYYPEYAYMRHPRLRHVMYGSHAPLFWRSRQAANIYHFVNRPHFIPSKNKAGFLIEPNDHILSFCNTFRYHKPCDAIRRASSILESLIDIGMKGLLVNTKTGLFDQFNYYLPNHAKNLLIHYDDARCINMLTFDQLKKKQIQVYDPNYQPKIVVLSAGWIIKHISSIVHAYVARPRKAHLILCVPDLPLHLERVLQESDNKFTLIKSSPLPSAQKDFILRNSDISIALTSVDGGSNALEGIEYGHALITNHYHRSPQFASPNNALFCELGSNYYELGLWGEQWQNVSEFMESIPYLRDPLDIQSITSHIESLDNALSILLEQRDKLAKMQLASLHLAVNQSVELSNHNLRNIYMKFDNLPCSDSVLSI